MKYLGIKSEGLGLVIYQSLASQLENYIRSGDGDAHLGKHLTVDASGDGNYSASLFLKKNNHQYEFFTNASGKFGAYDKTNSATLFEADRRNFIHRTSVDMSNNRITNLPTPDGPAQPATKQYVDTKFSEISIPEVDLSNYLTQNAADSRYARNNHTHDNYLTEIPSDVVRTEAMQTYVTEQIGNISIPEVDLSGYLTQDTADGRYARASHTHTSSDISDSITRIGTSASANKLVKTDSSGFLDIIHPNDNSPEKSIITKKFFDTKIAKITQLESEVETLKSEMATLKENSGKVKNEFTDSYLDVWVGPEANKPNSTNKLVFVEKE